MDKPKACSKCKGEMLESYAAGVFQGERVDRAISKTDTIKYMCRICGYIEEYAEDPKFYEKTG